MGTHKLIAIWQILRSRSFYLFSQRADGQRIRIDAAGKGDIGDMVMLSLAMKEQYDTFVETITQAVTDGGELHLLEEIRQALDILEEK